MRKTPENLIKLDADQSIPHEDFVDIWIDQYVQGDARRGVSILLGVTQSLTKKLEDVTGKKVHQLFPEY